MAAQPSDDVQGEAIPLQEQTAYVPRPEVEALVPTQPEVFQATAQPGPSTPADPTNVTTTLNTVNAAELIDSANLPPPIEDGAFPTASDIMPPPREGIGGMLITPDPGLVDQFGLRNLPDPFAIESAPRQSSKDLFKSDSVVPPDGALLQKFVTPQRMRDLWHQIDALQEDVIQRVRADRSMTDAYQKDLLQASTMLLESSANYDEARQIVYRVRGDLNREQKVLADIRRYRPTLIGYYAVWFLVIVFASRFDPQFRALIPENLPILKLAYPPILFGMLGALVNGIMALNEHTTLKRDFDPIYVSWYLINPLIGAVLGLVVFIFFVVTGTSFTPNLLTDKDISAIQAPLAIWLLSFIVGWQQNTAIKLLNGFLKLVSPASKESAQADRPTTTPPSDGPKG